MKRTPHMPMEILPLGDPALLDMAISQAAAYWGVESPIQKRDRKSGATKRSQLETEAIRRALRAI